MGDIRRSVDLGGGRVGVVSLDEPVFRYAGNPILTARHVNAAWTEPT